MAMASAWAGEAAQTRILGHIGQENSRIQLPPRTGPRGVDWVEKCEILGQNQLERGKNSILLEPGPPGRRVGGADLQ